MVAPALSLSTANKKQLLAYNTKLAVDRFKAHKLDTGSTPVQSKAHMVIYMAHMCSLLNVYNVQLLF